KTRKIKLERADGEVVSFRVDDKVRNLPQVKVGDEVAVTYYEALAFAVWKEGEAEPGAEAQQEIARPKEGAKPAGVAAQVTTVTATITAIDEKAETVTLKGPDGESFTTKVRHPENLKKVDVGDHVELTYSEALAIAVDTPAKKK